MYVLSCEQAPGVLPRTRGGEESETLSGNHVHDGGSWARCSDRRCMTIWAPIPFRALVTSSSRHRCHISGVMPCCSTPLYLCPLYVCPLASVLKGASDDGVTDGAWVQDRMHTHRMHTHARTHTPTHTRTHKHTHTQRTHVCTYLRAHIVTYWCEKERFVCKTERSEFAVVICDCPIYRRGEKKRTVNGIRDWPQPVQLCSPCPLHKVI